MNWSTDWEAAPKESTKMLILLGDSNITTGCFYWYTESDQESFGKPVAFWSLHDLVRDMPLDEDGPVEESNLKWAPFP